MGDLMSGSSGVDAEEERDAIARTRRQTFFNSAAIMLTANVPIRYYLGWALLVKSR